VPLAARGGYSHLRSNGARSQQALQVLGTVEVNLRNLPGEGAGAGSFWAIFRRRQDGCLQWAENVSL
jgi:hypothetical protein